MLMMLQSDFAVASFFVNGFYLCSGLFQSYPINELASCYLIYPSGKICPVLDIREATPNTTNVEYETVVEFTCNVGYILAHNHDAEDMITTCLHTAQWDKQVPDCRGLIIS